MRAEPARCTERLRSPCVGCNSRDQLQLRARHHEAQPAIYRSICSQFGIEPGNYLCRQKGEVLMIGDAKRCDRDGPRSVGITGFHLDRTGRGSLNDLVQFADLLRDHKRKSGLIAK